MGRLRPYESATFPGLHSGLVSVLAGAKAIDLGLGHANAVMMAWPDGLPPGVKVEVAKGVGARRHLFDIAVKEIAGLLVSGGLVVAPTTASTQASGTGNTAWRVNVGLASTLLGGKAGDVAASVDLVVHSGSFLTSFDSGDSCVAAIVLKNASGTLSFTSVKGASAVTGSEVAPTDAEIQAHANVGAGVPWLRLANTTLNRTGDTTVTQTYDNAVRFTGKVALGSYDVRFMAITDGPVSVG